MILSLRGFYTCIFHHEFLIKAKPEFLIIAIILIKMPQAIIFSQTEANNYLS